MAERAGNGWIVEDGDAGPRLVVTGAWTADAAAVVASGEVEELWLNYAHGFSEPTLDFIEEWPLKRLDLIARGIDDVSPIERLRSLESLSMQPSPKARLDVSRFPRLIDLSAFWRLVTDSLAGASRLERLLLYQCRAETVAEIPLPDTLRELELTHSTRLRSLEGIERLGRLDKLKVALAPQLRDASNVGALCDSLTEFELETCRKLASLDGIERLRRLVVLGFSDCGDIPTLAPLRDLHALQLVYAWGDTRVLDADLSALADLPNLVELRMRDRREYRPHVRDLVDENLRRTR